MNFAGLLEVIPMALEGWAGVFAVTIIIVGVIAVLNKVCK